MAARSPDHARRSQGHLGVDLGSVAGTQNQRPRQGGISRCRRCSLSNAESARPSSSMAEGRTPVVTDGEKSNRIARYDELPEDKGLGDGITISANGSVRCPQVFPASVSFRGDRRRAGLQRASGTGSHAVPMPICLQRDRRKRMALWTASARAHKAA